jgi:hypothetical protein
MTKFIEERVSDSFRGDQSASQAKEYSESAYATWKDISASLSRSALLIFLLMAIFELLAYQHSLAIISIGSFAIANAPIVQIALPAVIAFIIYDGYRLSVRWLELQRVYITLMKIYAPKQFENRLYLPITPSLPSLWGIGQSFAGDDIASPADKFIEKISVAIMYITMSAVPIVFECQAYYRLIQEFGYRNILLWISLTITVILFISTFIFIELKRYTG